MKKEKYVGRIISVLKERGLGLSMEAIAEAIGVTKKTLYNQFVSKDELTACCLESIHREFEEAVNVLSDENLSPQDGFIRGIQALRMFFKDNSHTFFADLSKEYPAMASTSHIGGTGYFEDQLKKNILRGMALGVYRKNLDAVLLSKYIATSVFGFYQREVMRSGLYSASYYFDQVITFNLNALLS